MLEQLRVSKTIAAGGTERRDDQNLGKIGDLISLVQIWYLGLTDRARTGYNGPHLFDPSDLVTGDLHRVRGDDYISLVTETDDIPVHVLGNLF